MPQPVTAGRTVTTVANLMYSVGAFIADFSETHVLNPRWPPHAKFHNGQTMNLGVLLASCSLYFLYKPASDARSIRENFFHASLIGTFYCGAGLGAILFPGTAWQDPEFEYLGDPQKYIFTLICALMWVGYGLEMRRLGKAKAA